MVKIQELSSAEQDTLVPQTLSVGYFKSIVTDFKYTATRPLHWQGRDFKNLGIVIGGVGVLMIADKKIKSVFQHNQNNFTNSVAKVVEPFGNEYSPYFVAGLYAAGTLIKNERWKSTSLMAAKSMVISTGIYLVVKSAIRRNRPLYTENNMDFYPPFSSDDKHTSFPSGHTLTVTTVATAVSEAFGKDHPWVPYVAYGIAGLTGVSRLYHNRHWSSDVWLGGALAYFVTRSVFKNNRKKKKYGFEIVWR